MTFYPLIKRARSHKIPMGNEKAGATKPAAFEIYLAFTTGGILSLGALGAPAGKDDKQYDDEQQHIGQYGGKGSLGGCILFGSLDDKGTHALCLRSEGYRVVGIVLGLGFQGNEITGSIHLADLERLLFIVGSKGEMHG